MKEKIISFDENTQKKIFEGALKACKIVGSTLGPMGANAIFQKSYDAPPITNDGVTIAKHLVLNDEIEDLGAQSVVEACQKTNDMAGDGTTTTAVLIRAILETALERTTVLGGEKLMVLFANEIRKQAKIVIEKIKEQSREANETDLKHVAITSLEDVEKGTIVADIAQKLGKNGVISVEDNWFTQYDISYEVTTGMRKLGTYASPYFRTNNKKEAVWENTQIIICNHSINSSKSIDKLLNESLKSSNKNYVIFNGNANNPFSQSFVVSVLNTIVARQKGNTNFPNILLVKVPSLTSEELEDMAVFCNAQFIDNNKGMKLEDITTVNKLPSDAGFAAKVVVNEDEVIIIGGQGKAEERIKALKEQLSLEKDMMFKKKLEKRIAGLSTGIGVIRVGAATRTERTYWKDKIEDAKNSAQAALEEGVVKGGGLCLKEIAEELGEDNVLYHALCAPYKTIQENAGYDLEVLDTVLDSTKVVRCAVQNACSVASALVTVKIGIAERTKTLWDFLEKKLIPHENSDFRADENQDMNLR